MNLSVNQIPVEMMQCVPQALTILEDHDLFVHARKFLLRRFFHIKSFEPKGQYQGSVKIKKNSI